jgi:chaperone protein EcpD
MRHLTRSLAIASMCLAGFLATSAQAGVVISGTRVVYPAQNREVTVGLTNDDKQTPRLVQTWIDSGNEKMTPDKVDVPFNVTPPVFRMEPGASQSLRIVYTKEPLATDKESLFYLNVLEVPPKPADAGEANMLQFAFRIRIKLFFRPAGLAGSAQDAPSKLTWNLVTDGSGKALEVHNPTPYYVSFQNVEIANGAQVTKPENDMGMVAPNGSFRFPLKDKSVTSGANTQVRFSSINDAGGFVPATASLQP